MKLEDIFLQDYCDKVEEKRLVDKAKKELLRDSKKKSNPEKRRIT